MRWNHEFTVRGISGLKFGHINRYLFFKIAAAFSKEGFVNEYSVVDLSSLIKGEKFKLFLAFFGGVFSLFS